MIRHSHLLLIGYCGIWLRLHENSKIMTDQVFNINFVQEVEKYPCLFNNKLSEYSRRDVTEKAWSDVGKTVNLTGSQCREKWKNLRAVFVRHLKSHASGPSAKTRKPYYLADAMQFAIPYIKALKTLPGKSRNKKRDSIAAKYNEEDEDDVKSVPSFSHMPYPVLTVSPLHTPSSLMSSPPPTPPPRSGHPDVKNGKKLKRTNIDVSNEDFLKAKIEKTANDAMEDPKRMFLLSLLPDVNAMSDNQMRTFKRRVISLVEEILQEKSYPPT